MSSRKTLAEFSPRVAAMANGWDPSTVSSHSKKKLDWICSLGHTWQCAVGDMTAKNLGCPYCSGQRTLSGFNDLLTKFPDIAAQAHGWDPTTVAPRSSKKMEWKCEVGHVSIAPVSSRTAGNGCPYCSGSKTLAGFNDLATTHPQLAAEAHGWDPLEYSKGSNYLAEWICTHGHVWKTSISERRSKNLGCPYCSGKRTLAGFNDLATTRPQIAAEAHGWDPASVTKGSGKVKEWKCNSGHVFRMSVVDRTANGLGCQFCSGQKVLAGFNDLATVEPDIAAQAHGWDPTTVTKGSKQIKEWKCKEGHTWNAVVHQRTGSDRTGCPVCNNNIVFPGFNDLETKFPNIGKQAYGWDPRTTLHGTNSKREWICEGGHIWSATVSSRTLSKTGCPVCIGRKVLVGFNDLATTHPELATTAIGWDPSSVTFGSNKIRKWVCLKGHYFDAPIASRVSRGRGCPYCAGQKILVGFNDLSTTDPNIASEAIGWDPSTVTRATQKKRKWICALGHQWTASIAGRTKENSGCPSCAKPGFDPNKQAWLYFLENTDLAMWQIGITNYPDQRLSKHAKGGWELIELRGPMEGDLTQDLESNCLKSLVKRGAILGHKAGIEKFDGYSEAWTKASLPVSSIKQILDWVYEDEAK